MSVKVTFELELTELELRTLLDNRLTAAGKSSYVPEIESKDSGKEDHAPGVVKKKIREQLSVGIEGNQQVGIKARQGAGVPPRMVAQEPSSQAPAFITKIENLNDFLRNQKLTIEDRNMQLLDLDNASSWLH